MKNTMKETMNLAAELAKVMNRYNLDEETVRNIIEVHEGDVKKAIRTIEAAQRTIKAVSK